LCRVVCARAFGVARWPSAGWARPRSQPPRAQCPPCPQLSTCLSPPNVAPERNNRPEHSPGPSRSGCVLRVLVGSNDSSATSARARSSCCSPQGPRMLPRSFTRLQSAAVHELPDLAILADALDTALSGRSLQAWATRQSLVVRGTPAELDG